MVKDSPALKLIMFIHEMRGQRNKEIMGGRLQRWAEEPTRRYQTSEMGNRASTNRIGAVPAGMIGLYEERGGGPASSYFRKVFALLSVKIPYGGG